MEELTNKAINVVTYDVAEMKKNWRIVYFPDKSEMIVVSSLAKAKEASGLSWGTSVILTKSQAPKAYPDVFTNSEIGKVSLQKRTIVLHVSPEQYAFCHRFGDVSKYLRMLIDTQMKQSHNVSNQENLSSIE